MKSAWGAWLFLAGLLMSHVGCCSVQMVGDGCGMGVCEPGGFGMSSCGGSQCSDSSCGDASCGGCGDLHLPFAGVGRRVANHVRGAHCAASCGEIYWDEHINDPPVCDPCGCNGEFTGERCGSCPKTVLGRLKNLWGHHYHPSSCGCSTCGGGEMAMAGSSSCSTCASGHAHSETSHTYSTAPSVSQPTVRAKKIPASPPPQQQDTPTPAVPRIQKPAEPKSLLQTPTPDPNAIRRPSSSKSSLAIGSGITFDEGTPLAVPQSTRTVKAKPTSTTQASKRLVTNPK